MVANDIPPTFEPTSFVQLTSLDHSKITSVSLYSNRAEITRLYQFTASTGQNQVNITGLPNVLDKESLRVEGRGAATIHDVVVSRAPQEPVVTTSSALAVLLLKKQRTEKALQRCKKSIASLETYLGTLNVERVNVSQIGDVMRGFDSQGEQLDDRVLGLEQQLSTTEDEIRVERERLAGPSKNDKLGLRAAIGIFAASEGDVEIVLIYAVHSAYWSPGYYVRVDMQTKETPVMLIYKAAITQSTGEAWDDVPLTLETTTPTFGVGVPHLNPWQLSIYTPAPVHVRYKSRSMSFGGEVTRGRGGPLTGTSAEAEESDEDMGFGLFDGAEMEHRGLQVSSKGNLSATFRVPGMISIPSDGEAHTVTIVQLKLEASLSWVTVPKEDARAHLKAKIKNASDYTFLPGNGSVYVDGSFIAKSNVPAVSPQESFDCPLGLDPSIRVTYYPRSKRLSQSGFYSKSANHVFTQRITIFNTKAISIDQFKVIDQVPVSENSQIAVKVNSPALTMASSGTSATKTGSTKSVKVGEGIVAQWDRADEAGLDEAALGKDGKLNWVCSIPSQARIHLLLHWEVSCPANMQVAGL
jgi:uncharacterized protein (TIGR02231 family)